MEKNKNRTDLLAAGRKKLQQYRQKKDGKGSKSSGKANKPDPDVVPDESSVVGKTTKGKKQLPATEVHVLDSAIEHVDSHNPDVLTPDRSSTSDLPIEVSETDESINASVSDEYQQSSNLDEAMPAVTSPRTVNIDENPESADGFTPGELKAASGEDQVPDVGETQERDHSCSVNKTSFINVEADERAQVNLGDVEEDSKMEYTSSATEQISEGDHSCSEPDNKTSFIDVEADERARVIFGDVEEDSKMEYTSSATEQISQCDGFPVFASAIDSDTKNADLTSSAPLSFDHEPTIQSKEIAVIGFHVDEGIKLPLTSGNSDVIPVSLTQLAKAFQLLGEGEFRFVMSAREAVVCGDLKNDGDMKSDYAEFSERIREQLYLNNIEKELVYLQLYEESDAGKEFDNEKSSISASLGDVKGKNKILSEELAKCKFELDRVTSEMDNLQKQFSFSKSALDQSSSCIEELQIELDRSEHQLSYVSSELVDSRSLLSVLQEKNENLNVSVASLTEEKHNLEKEKGDVILENEKMMKELMECKSLLELSQVENANIKESLALVKEERAKLEDEKENYVSEKESLLTDLVEWKRSMEALQAENASLHAVLTSEREDGSKLEEANRHFAEENKNFSTELLESQHLVENLRSEIANFEKARTRYEEEINHLSGEKEEAMTELTNHQTLVKDLQMEYEKSMSDLKDGAMRLSQLTEQNVTLTSTLDTYKAKNDEFVDWKMKSEQTDCQERISIEDNSQHPLEQGERDVVDDSSGLVALKRHLIEVEKAMKELDKAISEMHSQSAVSPGVSKLVQNFELKGHTDELEERSLSTEDSEPYMTVKKNMDSLKDLFRFLVLDAENASKLIKVNTSGKTPSDSTLEELMVRFEAMKEQSNSLEETFFKHVILDEFVKQYVCTVEAKKGELVVLCEDLRQEGITTKRYNSELTEKLRSSESRIVELQAQADELQQQADYMASLCNQLETLHKKLDASIGTVSVTHPSDTGVDQDINTRMVTSVDAAVAVIQALQEKVEDALRNHNLLSDSFKELAEKTKEFEGRNELASYVIHKVFDNLQKIVNDLPPCTEQSEEDTTSEQLDHLEISNYDVFIERLIMILRERSQLESKNREYNLELVRRIKDMEELNKRCIHPEVIVKLFEDIQCSVTLDGIEIKPDEPVSSLDSLIQFLVKKLKSYDMKSIESQDEIDHLTFSIVPYEIENHVLKGSLISAMEHLVTIQSETQLKETELHQSEQRISALREKLHIAVTKGKGLIQHRDSLKQNLSAKSSELEKCLHELQLKEATLQETEAKLKSHSEAGERMKALESELSYIRNSATALRESFLLKDSVLERIEEILEDLDLPEDFHMRDIIDKIDWLAKSVFQSQNSFPLTSSNQTSLIERTRSYPESGSRAMDGWIEDREPSSGPADDELRRNYDELQNKFYGLAEHNEMLEQSLMERNNLVQRCEEVLDNINMPSQLRSLEPEDRIEWLRVALLQANDRCGLLQQDINDLEKIRGSLAADLEESQRRLVDLQSTLKSITDEREQLSSSLDAQRHDYNKVSEKSALYEIENNKLQKEVGALQLKLDEKLKDEEHIRQFHGEIRRLQDLVKDLLQVPEITDLDSSTSDIQYLEILLRELVDKHITATSELTHGERSVDQSTSTSELERKLEEVESDLVRVKDERDRQVETNQSLVTEGEALKAKNQELQNLLVQEEQKCATVKEKLNVAVRKGKSLVQVRDSMKQTINDLTSQVERLDAEIKFRENTLLENQEKMKNLFTLQEMVENKDSEIRFLKNRLQEADSELQNKRSTLTMILGSLAEIDLGAELRTNDPIEKLKQIEEVIRELQLAMSSSEQETRKSNRAAELLLAELNEVQERNEDLLEEISELSEQRELAEAAKRESLSHLEQLSALHLEERSSQFSELMNLKSALDQLRPRFSKIYGLLNDVLPKDLDYLYNLEASVKSLLEISDTGNMGGQTRYSSQVTIRSELFSDSKTEKLQLHDENKIIDIWRFIGTYMQGLITNINGFEENLERHSKCLHEEIIRLSETVATLGSEITSYKQKETEYLMLRKYISMLYEACKKTVLEIEKTKGQLVPNDYSGEDILSGETLSVSEERITSMMNRLFESVKDFHSIQSENMDVNLNEMKSTISSLRKELTEKDVQKDRICVDLVSQIKRAEAAAMSHLEELEPAKAQINDLKGQLEAVNLQRNSLVQKVKELETQESELVDLNGKVKSLTDALTAKEQEAEALLQALDEEESQMEEMTNKITELERVVQQKNLDLENSEAARGKALKKLSITVGKFDELHRLSETLVSEVDKLQSQLQERDSEVSFLRKEITRCTSDSLQALETDKKGLNEIQDILTWLDSMVSEVETNNIHFDVKNKIDLVHDYKETLKKQITSIISELKDLRQEAQSKDDLLHIERGKVDDLMRRRELLESSLREKESRLSLHENDPNSAQRTSLTSEIVEVEPVLNKWPSQGTSMAAQVRSLRKVNNDQLAIFIDDMDTDDKDKLEDDDDDKAHGFKSLTTSKLVPRFTRPITDFVDGLWVSCDRTLMRQPALRLSLIIYWAVMHALLAVFVV